MPAALVDRWYAFLPWIACLALVARRHGALRALLLGGLGWAIAFGAEWGSTAGPGVPFGAYVYRAAALGQDWRVAGVPVFDSLSFTWLAVCGWTLTGWAGARGWGRWLAAVVTVVAVDLVVDPVALRGAHWWLGRIYRYPGGGPWFGVTLANYAGWAAVAAVLVGLCALLLRAPAPVRGGRAPASWSPPGWLRGPAPLRLLAAALVLGVEVEAGVLAVRLGVGPALAASAAGWGLGLGLPAAAGGRAARRRRAAARLPPARRVVACALAFEARVVRRTLPGWRPLPPPPGVRRAWRRDGTHLWLTGSGPFDLPETSWPAAAGAVVVAGVGGAVAEGWVCGEVAVGTAWVGDDGGGGPLVPAAAGRPAVIAAAADAVDGAGRARWAAAGADVVDMETLSWGGWRERRLRHGGPVPGVTVLRAVLDTPDRPLGRARALVRAGAVGPDPLRLVGWLGSDPGAVPAMLRLAADRRRAARALGGAVALVLGVADGRHGERADQAAGRVAEPGGEGL